MIRIAITQAAFEAIAATLPLGSVAFEKELNAKGECHVWLDTRYPALEIIALTPQGDTGIVTTRATVHNQRGELVLDGEHQYALKTAPRGGK